jgi:hypothetical protein
VTRYWPQWLQARDYAASVDRRLLGALWPAPATAGVEVGISGSGAMDVAVQPGQVAVPTANSTGSTLCTSDDVEIVTLTAAEPAGTDRVDLIVCRARGTDLGDAGFEDFIFEAVRGDPALPPAPVPPTPAGTVALARVLVPGGSAMVDAANITDVRPYGLAVNRAGDLPPPLAAGAPFQSFTDDAGEVWVAKGGVNGGAWKRARDVLHCAVSRNTPYTYTINTPIVYDTVDRDPYGLWDAAAVGFRVPVAGVYFVSLEATWSATAAGQYLNVAVGPLAFSSVAPMATNPPTVGAAPVYLDANAVLQMICIAPSCPMFLMGGMNWSRLDYLGTG